MGNRDKEKASIVLVILDVLSFFVSIFLSLLIRFMNLDFLRTEVFVNHLVFLSVVHFFWIILLYLLDFYNPLLLRDRFKLIGHLFVFAAIASVSGGIYFYLLPVRYIAPKTILFIHVLISSAFILTNRILIFQRLLARNLKTRIFVIGDESDADLLPPEALSGPHYELVGICSPQEFDESDGLSRMIKDPKPDLILLGNWIYENGRASANKLPNLPLGYRYQSLLDFYIDLEKRIPADRIGHLWLLENLSHNLMLKDYAKRAMDICVATLSMVLLSPFFIVIPILIKLTSPGPVIYKQKRVGFEEKPFTLYKFRTMRQDAEVDGPKWSSKNDPRVTPIGRLLRRTHLDEIPQLINILRGDLSFVGPRPERPEFVEELKKHIPYFELRHLVKPGLTGWAQVNFNYANSIEDSREKFSYDLYYIFNRSLALDVSILMRTFTKFFL
ncbi:MAG: sugar transferase [Candidatus Hadarchaeales archaeon]